MNNSHIRSLQTIEYRFPKNQSILFLPTDPQPYSHFNQRVCRKNMYDGIEEYCVVIREKGSREAEESHEERRTSSTKLEAHCMPHLSWSQWVAIHKQIQNIEGVLRGIFFFQLIHSYVLTQPAHPFRHPRHQAFRQMLSITWRR